mmetsp:Transcript_22805/g.40596  ORF Transcript_22805/g.40596 Transcript_22805/m.40596 type:complete len:148 (-) Transcript_22805:228-671(-)|eukprot:CAMPEP_0177774608 /NCGR_PEP_ID=MMETSP0491_2-20121128/13618_1 /TAXON_ID=63592 /ORGANISM="Tetraselmis chuii, Strain PLY429" /LENGTH=147 /DNA_ID=CAMNT_0019293039 /DNA_START=163 /DNA_END=606 /DNA_ORIENTATION=-
MTNYSYIAIAAAAGIAFVVTPIRVTILSRAAGGVKRYNNVNPRSAATELASKGKLKPETQELVGRLTACGLNAWENLPLFAAGVLAANQAKVEEAAVLSACAAYLFSRVVFTVSYAAGGVTMSWVRSVAYAVGTGASLKLLVNAANA